MMNYESAYPFEDYDNDCPCGRGDGCDCDGMEEKARGDEIDGKREAAETH